MRVEPGLAETAAPRIDLRSYPGEYRQHHHSHHQRVMPLMGTLEVDVPQGSRRATSPAAAAPREQGHDGDATAVVLPAGMSHGFFGRGPNRFVIVDLPAAHAARLLEQGGDEQFELHRADGRCLAIRTGHIREGAAEGVVVVLREVTEERAAQRRLLQAQDELRALNAQLEEMAHTDTLTGLANRRALDKRFAMEWSRARRADEPLAFLLFDLDHFKPINDTHGHQTGDEVLTTIGARLLEMVRPEDLAARYGGEELALLLPETGAEAAIDTAERLRWAIGELEFGSEGRTPFHVTVSIGIAVREGEGDSPAAMTNRADAALYHAKESGRDLVVLARAEGEALAFRHAQG